MNPVHSFACCSFKNHCNCKLPSTPRTCKGYPAPIFFTKPSMYFIIVHACPYTAPLIGLDFIFLLFSEGIKISDNPQYAFIVACHYYSLSGLIICPSFLLSKAVNICQVSVRGDGHKIEYFEIIVTIQFTVL